MPRIEASGGHTLLAVALALLPGACASSEGTSLLLQVIVEDEAARPQYVFVTLRSPSGAAIDVRMPEQGTLPSAGRELGSIFIELDATAEGERQVTALGMSEGVEVSSAAVVAGWHPGRAQKLTIRLERADEGSDGGALPAPAPAPSDAGYAGPDPVAPDAHDGAVIPAPDAAPPEHGPAADTSSGAPDLPSAGSSPPDGPFPIDAGDAVVAPPPPPDTRPLDSSTSATLVLSPAADTFLNINTHVNASTPRILVYTWPHKKRANVILMQFDLSAIPAAAVIETAFLDLTLASTDPTADPTYSISAHRIVNKKPALDRATGDTYDGVNRWTENACCHDGHPLAQADISAPYDIQLVDKTLTVKTWDIRSMVREWVGGAAANYGLLLNADPTKDQDRWRSFASMEDPAPQRRPALRITYRLP